MRQMQNSMGRTLFLAILVVGLTAGFVSQPVLGQLTPIEQAVVEAKPVSYLLISQPFFGAMKDSGDLLRSFMDEFTSQGLESRLADGSVKPLEILQSDPDQASAIAIRIGFPVVAGSARPSPPLVESGLSFPKAVVYTHKGSYSGLASVHAQIDAAVVRYAPGYRTAWPVALRLLTDPNTVSPNLIQTEIIVPLQPLTK